jgi:hypothetical protein
MFAVTSYLRYMWYIPVRSILYNCQSASTARSGLELQKPESMDSSSLPCQSFSFKLRPLKSAKPYLDLDLDLEGKLVVAQQLLGFNFPIVSVVL